MWDVHYIKLIERIIDPNKGGTLQKTNTGLFLGSGPPYYMEKMVFSALIKQIFKTVWQKNKKVFMFRRPHFCTYANPCP